jgi:U4/U6.U5 tri-snRNP-associated protein 2
LIIENFQGELCLTTTI